MTAQYYVTEFNKSLYDKEVMAQIFFIPSEALLVRPNKLSELMRYSILRILVKNILLCKKKIIVYEILFNKNPSR